MSNDSVVPGFACGFAGVSASPEVLPEVLPLESVHESSYMSISMMLPRKERIRPRECCWRRKW